MSCALVLAASLAFADMTGAAGAAAVTIHAPENPLAAEPLYADIVSRAGALGRQASGFRSAGMKASPRPLSLAGFPAFKADAATLAALDMRGHFDLAARGVDGDLKCILKGIAEDLPRKIEQLEQARTGAEQDAALDELAYLLNDNVAVITAPPGPPA